jgi:hypothetical protein
MVSIQFTDRGTAVRVSQRSRTLARAAVAALAAPSLLNTQPWRWRIDDDLAQLRADRDRQVGAVDLDGRLLTLSCGVALHHARIALAADGVRAEVAYLPDPHDPDLLATIRHAGPTEITAEARRMRRAMAIRHTDRRPFADREIPRAALDALRHSAEAAGAHLHFPRPQDVVTLTVAAGQAATVELADPAYLATLTEWVQDAAAGRDGVPPATTAPIAARPVPIREFTPTSPQRSTVHNPLVLADRCARYAVLFTDGDRPADWLAAGEALSAVLLTATTERLATSPMSDLVEVAPSRALLRGLLADIGYPAIVIRIGVPAAGDPAPAPRRPAVEAVELVAEPIPDPGAVEGG